MLLFPKRAVTTVTESLIRRKGHMPPLLSSFHVPGAAPRLEWLRSVRHYLAGQGWAKPKAGRGTTTAPCREDRTGRKEELPVNETKNRKTGENPVGFANRRTQTSRRAEARAIVLTTWRPSKLPAACRRAASANTAGQ
jgi:hypothetical protein